MKTRLLLVMTALLTLATGVKAYDAFVVWDNAKATLYFSYGAVPTAGDLWTNEAGNDVTATDVWSGTQVTETGDATPDWVGSAQGTCKKVIFEKSFVNVKPTSCVDWFLNFTKLTSIEGLANLDTSEVTNMSFMFQNYQGEYLDLTGFDTSKVTDMTQMFCACESVKAIVISDKWKTTQVTGSDYMFTGCFALVGEDGTTFDTSSSAVNDKTKANTGTGGYLTSNSLYDDATSTAKYLTLAAAGVSTFKLSGRTIKGGKWNTLCIPSNIADLSASALAGAKVKKLKEYTNDGTSVTITFEDATSIEAGKPYLVKPTADITDPVFDFAGVAAGSTTVTGAEFIGTYQASTLTAPNKKQLFLQDDKFYYPGTSDATLNAFRAYFSVTENVPVAAASRGIEIDIDGVSTGIDFIENKATGEVKVIYDLSGRRVAHPTKGLYIVNGKKVVIK